MLANIITANGLRIYAVQRKLNLKHKTWNYMKTLIEKMKALRIYAVMCRFLFVGWAIYRIIGIVFGVVIYMPYWLLTGENVVWKIDSYFDRICPRVY